MVLEWVVRLTAAAALDASVLASLRLSSTIQSEKMVYTTAVVPRENNEWVRFPGVHIVPIVVSDRVGR